MKHLKSATFLFLLVAGLLLCVLCGCEPKVPSPLNQNIKVPLSVAEAQLPVKVAQDVEKNKRDASVAKAKADAILDDAAARVDLINQEASVSASKASLPVVREAKASASELVANATAEIESRIAANAAAKAELEAARAAYDAQMGMFGSAFDFVAPVAQAGATSVGGPLALLAGPLLAIGGYWVKGRQKKAEDAAWDEATATAEKNKKSEDAAWDQAQVAGQLQAALIALINKNNTPPPSGTVAQ